MIRWLPDSEALRYDSLASKVITYISIDGREKLVCVLVIVLTGVGHDSVKHCLLLLGHFLLVILSGGFLDQVNFSHLSAKKYLV